MTELSSRANLEVLQATAVGRDTCADHIGNISSLLQECG